MMTDLDSGIDKSQVAARFHSGIANGFVQAAIAARSEIGLDGCDEWGGNA